MAKADMIGIELICSSYNVEPHFIDELIDFGLVQVITVENDRYIEPSRINDLERIIRLHYDMSINLEGIETIVHLLDRIKTLQDELNSLKNRLLLYEHE